MSIFQKKRSEAGRAREQEKQESSLWERDKEMVFNSCATFSVKVLGEIPVDEARGVEICEYAAKDIPYKKNKTRGQLKIYAHGLTFVEEKANALVINQTIEKVSFCCALPSNDRVFTYISRDGFTRQWVCHAFVTKKGISADRVSHACACAFTACLQKKQKERSKVGLPPLGEAPGPAGPGDSALSMRRVRSSGDVLELGGREQTQFGTAPRLRPLGGSRGDLLEESMEIREAAAKQTSIKMLLESTEMNGQIIPTDMLITSPRVKFAGFKFETNFNSPAKNRLSVPGNPFDSHPDPVDPWAPAASPKKRAFLDPFDPFSLISSGQQHNAPAPAATQLNPFSSLPLGLPDSKPMPPSGATNPFI